MLPVPASPPLQPQHDTPAAALPSCMVPANQPELLTWTACCLAAAGSCAAARGPPLAQAVPPHAAPGRGAVLCSRAWCSLPAPGLRRERGSGAQQSEPAVWASVLLGTALAASMPPGQASSLHSTAYPPQARTSKRAGIAKQAAPPKEPTSVREGHAALGAAPLPVHIQRALQAAAAEVVPWVQGTRGGLLSTFKNKCTDGQQWARQRWTAHRRPWCRGTGRRPGRWRSSAPPSAPGGTSACTERAQLVGSNPSRRGGVIRSPTARRATQTHLLGDTRSGEASSPAVGGPSVPGGSATSMAADEVLSATVDR